MVVILLISDLHGPFHSRSSARRRVTFVSYVNIKPLLYTQISANDAFATTKEEEWISKKKTEVVNKKQIETRVKRQVVVEDGKVVEDSGPQVTSNTTEDTETQEHHQTELRKLDDDDNPPQITQGGNVFNGTTFDGVVREVKERRVISREETEEVKETEDVQHHGDITDELWYTMSERKWYNPVTNSSMLWIKTGELLLILLHYILTGTIVSSEIYCSEYWAFTIVFVGLCAPTYLSIIMIGYHLRSDEFCSYPFNASIMIMAGGCLIAGGIGYILYPPGITTLLIAGVRQSIHCHGEPLYYAIFVLCLAAIFLADAAYTIYRFANTELVEPDK